MRLQILIPTLPERREMFERLGVALAIQAQEFPFGEIGFLHDSGPRGVSIGTKRNHLLSKATAEYVAFFDDDDWPEPNYISSIMEGIEKGVDCCSLRGVITWNGQNPEVYEHSVRYSAWRTNHTGPIKYERYPNHLNAIKREIAQQFRFPETNHGEDHDWSTQVFNSGLIKTEHYIDYPIYNYQFVPNK